MGRAPSFKRNRKLPTRNLSREVNKVKDKIVSRKKAIVTNSRKIEATVWVKQKFDVYRLLP